MINSVNRSVKVDDYLLAALKEDITSEDVTTNSILRNETMGTANLICKEDGIISGLDIFNRVFSLLGSVIFRTTYKDGDIVKNGDVIGVISGDMRIILSGERTALNYLCRMSGISTLTNSLVKALEGSNTKLLDTRKTTPNMRIFEKYAVTMGGGLNHRYNLSDGVLLKDNHIGAAGSITKAIEMAKEYAPFVRKIEIEVENLEMVREAVAAGADIIMLDNMDDATMTEAVAIIGDNALTECSGNVTLERLKAIAKTGVDYVSCGALTHSAPILDFSLKNLKPL